MMPYWSMSVGLSTTDRVIAGLTWVGGGVALVWLAMSFTYPFGWDQGLFAWVGGVVAGGGLPYRDAWDIKGPLLYYTYALAQWLFGVHLWSIRLVDAALLGVSAATVFRTTTALTTQGMGRFAVVLYVVWYGSHSYWHTAQPDGWAGMLVVVAMGSLLAEPAAPSARQLVRAGVCLGLAALLKPLWAVFIVLPMLTLVLSQSRQRMSLAFAALSGWILPSGIAIAWFVWQGALDDLIDVHLRYGSLYAGLASDGRVWGVAEYVLIGKLMGVSLPLSIFGALVLWRERRSVAVVLLTWLAVTVFLVVLQGRFYAYHWLPMLPAMTVLVAVGAQAGVARAQTVTRIACAATLLSTVAPIGLEAARFAAWSVGIIDREQYYNAYGEPGIDMQTLEWLETKGRPGKIFTFGWHSSVGWLSQRGTVSRFGYSLPLMMAAGTDYRVKYRSELMAALTVDPPRYIVVGALSDQILGTHLSVGDFPELASLIDRAYQPAAQFGSITVHEMRP